MTQIIQQLGKDLEEDLKKAREIWVAVAMISKKGMNFLTKSMTDAKVNIVVGIDLPTPPDVLDELYDLDQNSNQWNVWLKDKGYFHPKVYVLKFFNGRFAAYVGSGNLTWGGLHDHHEIGVRLTDQEACSNLIEIFHDYCESTESIKLTEKWLIDYRNKFVLRSEWIKKNEIQNEELKASARTTSQREKNLEIESSLRRKFVKDLTAYKNKNYYTETVQWRKGKLVELRKSVDYPKFENVDLDSFYKIKTMGSFRQTYKAGIKSEMEKFKKMLHYLSDSQVDLSERFDAAYDGDLKIKGISSAFISKILTICDPINCWVENEKSRSTLANYDVTLPKGMTPGQKYKAKALFLKSVCEEAGIPDMTILDAFLYDNAE
ncbi:MAG: restriction endonuclease PLD domain-containing protein [Algoriphagus aquaeductus]|uniref:restriction endonuclease PLD domain-containing protein n=1 Tax=Algoriphagus aquaeductus TaxID=475299 RepID=UPI00387A2DFF